MPENLRFVLGVREKALFMIFSNSGSYGAHAIDHLKQLRGVFLIKRIIYYLRYHRYLVRILYAIVKLIFVFKGIVDYS